MAEEKEKKHAEPATPAAEKARPKPAKPSEPHSADFRYIIRIAGADLDGNRSVVYALTGVKGMGVRLAEIVADLAEVPRNVKIGDLPEAKVTDIEQVLQNLPEYTPHWILNRQNDWETGEDYHAFGSDIDLRIRDDINLMKKIRCYKGIRHEQGQKVRGQRTRSNGRTGLTVGVVKKQAIAAAQEKAKEEGGRKKEKKEEKKE
jgi:small subunit ribosomal protein S13